MAQSDSGNAENASEAAESETDVTNEPADGLVDQPQTSEPQAGEPQAGEPQGSETYAEGIKAFSEGDYKRAAILWLEDAYLGSADAQFNIGVLYSEGKGLGKNPGEAVFWFTRAARQNHREAQYNLGHLLLEEKEDLEKIKEGIEWWRKSAENGFSIAQFNYGRALFYGVGAEIDRTGSQQWFERAAEGGNQRAADFLTENQGDFIDAPGAQDGVDSVIVSDADTALLQQPKLSAEQAAKSDYVLVKDTPTLMYARFNTLSPVVTRIGTKILLRVVSRNRDWILVEVPGGVPGWIRADSSKADKGLVEVTAELINVHADPTENSDSNDVGKLQQGAKVLLLEQEQGWTRVLLPEKIPGWVEAETVDNVKATPEEIANVWQAQRVRRRIAALASREVKIAANPRPAEAVEKVDPTETAGEHTGTTIAQGSTSPDTILVASDEPSGKVGIIIEAMPAAAVPVDPQARLSQAADDAESQDSIKDQTIDSEEASTDDIEVLASGTIGAISAEISSAEVEVAAVQNEQAETQSTAARAAPQSFEPQAETPVVEAVKTETEEPASQAAELSSSEQIAAVSQAATTIQRTIKAAVPVLTGSADAATTVVSLPLNTLVDVVGVNGDFSEVTIPGGLPVWISALAADIRNEKVVITSSRARAKASPLDASNFVLGLLPQGSVMSLIGQQSGWLRVVAPEWITGWVRSKDLLQPENTAGLNKIWGQQARSLLTSYLGEDISELALVPDLEDSALLGTGITNDNQWLFEQSSRKYTLQLFSMPNPSSARSLFKSLNGRGQFFSTMVKEQRWYFVMLGKFLTSEAAKAVAANLPSWASGARVRSLARLQVNRCKKIGEYNEDEARNLAELCR